MNDNFDLKQYLGSKRLLTENYEEQVETIEKTVDPFRSRLRESIKTALTEAKKKKTKKIDPEDIDIDSAFTKEPEEQPADDIQIDVPQPEEQPAANPVNLDANGEQKPGYSKEEQEIQNSLKTAYDHAVSINDQKLATQIGNSLKFFINTHVVKPIGI